MIPDELPLKGCERLLCHPGHWTQSEGQILVDIELTIFILIIKMRIQRLMLGGINAPLADRKVTP